MFRLPIIAALGAVLCFALAACGPATRADTTDIAGVMPPLAFSLTRANDSAAVTAADYRGKAVLLYFGYTHCPDECPTTLANLASVLKQLGPAARDVRMLFVTIDPARDSTSVLKRYVEAFAPEIDGLRGSDDAIASLARRYRVLYRVTPAEPGRDYEVMHSDSLFLFDADGRARFVTTSTKDNAALAQRIRELLASG
jgi:protein SCO1/2